MFHITSSRSRQIKTVPATRIYVFKYLGNRTCCQTQAAPRLRNERRQHDPSPTSRRITSTTARSGTASRRPRPLTPIRRPTGAPPRFSAPTSRNSRIVLDAAAIWPQVSFGKHYFVDAVCVLHLSVCIISCFDSNLFVLLKCIFL